MLKTLPKKAYLIPDEAKIVFRGELFDVYQWNQKLFDGTTAIFEMLKRADTMQIMAIKGDKIVVIEDEQPARKPMLSLPGGRAEPSDVKWLDAAKREMLEETGMSFRSWKLIGVVQPAPKIEWFCPLFVATEFDTSVKQELDAGEKITISEITFEELKRRVLSTEEPRLSYLASMLGNFNNIDELLNAQEFDGMEVDC